MVIDLDKKLRIVRLGVESLGSALMKLRGKEFPTYESSGGQLKTAVDKAAEAWIVTYLCGFFPTDRFLAEEEFEESKITWDAPPCFWTVDALDGTRSFVEGFEGFCVQVAYVVNGTPVLGVIHAPVWQTTYWAISGCGAYKQYRNDKPQKLSLPYYSDWPSPPIFIDSSNPQGDIGQLIDISYGQLLECGSFGLKICRVAEGKAHVFVKEAAFKLWDVAPGDLILSEAGGKLGFWDGTEIPYNSRKVLFENLVAAPESLFSLVVQFLSDKSKKGEHV